MKKIFLFLIIAASCNLFAQKVTTDSIKYDTLTAVLLITECDVCEAKAQFGYIARENEKYINYLDRNKKVLSTKCTVWGSQEKTFINKFKQI